MISSTVTPFRISSRISNLESELLDRHRFHSRAETRKVQLDFIEGWYNPYRWHERIDYYSSFEYDRNDK